MIKVKVTFSEIVNDFNIAQFCDNDQNVIENVQFFFDSNLSQDYDFWFIFDNIHKDYLSTNVRNNGIFFFSSEHIFEEDHYIINERVVNFINQFAKVYSCYSTFHSNEFYELPFLPWMINHNHGTYDSGHIRNLNFFKKLRSIEKPKFLSVICSNKVINSNQKVRLEFVKKLKYELGDQMDWFGNGINPIKEKWEAIAPYRYHIALENRIATNIISEKLYDSYMGLSLPLYSGAPNVYEYFPRDSLIPIDIKNWHVTLDLILSLQNISISERQQNALICAKNLVLNEFNLWQRLAFIAKSNYFNLGNFKQAKVNQLKSRSLARYVLDVFFTKL